MSAWAAYFGNVKLAQIRPETESIDLSSFQDVSRLEPFFSFFYQLKIAFLTSIYPAHAEKIYKENPSLKNKSSDEQMEFIRWDALSSMRWFELLEEIVSNLFFQS